MHMAIIYKSLLHVRKSAMLNVCVTICMGYEILSLCDLVRVVYIPEGDIIVYEPRPINDFFLFHH